MKNVEEKSRIRLDTMVQFLRNNIELWIADIIITSSLPSDVLFGAFSQQHIALSMRIAPPEFMEMILFLYALNTIK